MSESLPAGVVRKHGALYWISTNPDSKKQTWHRLGTTWTEAAPKYRELVIKTRKPGYVGRVIYGAGADSGPVPQRFLKEMLANAKKNAKARGLEFSLSLDEAKRLAERSGGRCELTSIRFHYGHADELADHDGRRKRIWAPSFDRIDSFAGYCFLNVRIVCFAANAAKQEFGDDVLLKVARGLVKTAAARRPISSAKHAETREKRVQKEHPIFDSGNADLSTGAA